MKLKYKSNLLYVSSCAKSRVRQTCRASEIDVIMHCFESVLFVYVNDRCCRQR